MIWEEFCMKIYVFHLSVWRRVCCENLNMLCAVYTFPATVYISRFCPFLLGTVHTVLGLLQCYLYSCWFIEPTYEDHGATLH